MLGERVILTCTWKAIIFTTGSVEGFGLFVEIVKRITKGLNRFKTSYKQKCRVIQNDCRVFNNLSYTIHLVLQIKPPCDFFLWGYVKDQVYVPPLPAGIPELKVLSCYKQFGTNSIIVLVFVDSQRVHI